MGQEFLYDAAERRAKGREVARALRLLDRGHFGAADPLDRRLLSEAAIQLRGAKCRGATNADLDAAMGVIREHASWLLDDAEDGDAA